jgi:hypothetical protein
MIVQSHSNGLTFFIHRYCVLYYYNSLQSGYHYSFWQKWPKILWEEVTFKLNTYSQKNKGEIAMEPKYRVGLIAFAIFLSSILSLNFAYCAEKFTIQSTEWNLIVHSFKDGLREIPVIGGLASIGAKNNQEGVIIRGVIQPATGNKRLVIELDYFKLIVGDKEFSPATADVQKKGKNSIESVQWPAGHSSTLSKEDFPAEISIMYLVTKNPQKALLIDSGKPVPISSIQ